MTPRQIRLVKDSFETAAPHRDRLAAIFFVELFAREPALRRLFDEVPSRRAELFYGLAAVIASLDRLYPILPALEWLAIRNARRGVGERQYAAAGEALLAALEAGLGDAFTPELREAWIGARRMIVRLMVQAAADEPLAA